MNKKAVILLSGGLDSSTCLAMAKAEGYDCYAISFDYGQRCQVELEAARAVCEAFSVIQHKVFQIDIGQFGGSALTDHSIDVPQEETDDIPITYVPARNTVFLSIALGWAEVIGARDIYIGANVIDYSGYPDCRPEYIEQYEKLANLATKAGVEGDHFKFHTPLMHLNKAEIIAEGIALGLDYALTNSCYEPSADGLACGKCASCTLRASGFKENGVEDPTLYVEA